MGPDQDRDLNQAAAWVRRAADQGYAQAQFALARLYFAGLGVNTDPAEAVRWLTRAVGQNHAAALALFGRANEYGEGTPRDAKKGFELYQRAAETGSSQALNWLGEFYLKGEGGTARRTNYANALFWFERAASNQIPSAAIQAASMHRHGQGTLPDLQRWLFFIRLAADAGSPDGMDFLAGFYAEGLGDPRGPEDAPIHWLRQAAILRTIECREIGSSTVSWALSGAMVRSCETLWNRYRFGVGTPRDYVATAQWMWQAYRENSRRAQARDKSATPLLPEETPLTRILNDNPPPSSEDERRWQQAARLVTEALDQNKPEASHRIGENYRDGSPLTPVDPRAAWGWFARAVQLGHPGASKALKALEDTFSPDELIQAKRFWVPPLH